MGKEYIFKTVNDEKVYTNKNWESPVYIYGLVNSLDNKIFYVGKSQTPLLRMNAHIYQSKRSSDGAKVAKIKDIFSLGGSIYLSILEEIEYNLYDLHLKKECWWITHLGLKGIELTNIKNKRIKELESKLQQP